MVMETNSVELNAIQGRTSPQQEWQRNLNVNSDYTNCKTGKDKPVINKSNNTEIKRMSVK